MVECNERLFSIYSYISHQWKPDKPYLLISDSTISHRFHIPLKLAKTLIGDLCLLNLIVIKHIHHKGKIIRSLYNPKEE